MVTETGYVMSDIDVKMRNKGHKYKLIPFGLGANCTLVADYWR